MENERDISIYFSRFPEGCISDIISFTSPKDACGWSILSKTFKSAAESDTVWERFLPSDYEEIIARSVSPLTYSSKKELYFHLCDHPILLDGGKLSFKLSKATGKKCYMLCARELGIAWGDTPRYWKWKSIPESRFTEVPELLHVSLLEIRGKIRAQMLSLKTAYAAYLVFRLNENSSGLDCASKALIRFADNGVRVELNEAELNEVEAQAGTVYLQEPSVQSLWRWARGRRMVEPIIDGLRARERTDGWMEIKLGEFYNNQEDDHSSIIEIMFWESRYTHWKHGLIVEGIELRPVEEAA